MAILYSPYMRKSRRRTPSITPASSARAEAAIQKVHAQIAALDYVATGTLYSRTKTCGQPKCACATDRTARHVPYFEWTRLKQGRLAHTVLRPTAAALLRKAIANNRRLRKLIRAWEQESLRVALATEEK